MTFRTIACVLATSAWAAGANAAIVSADIFATFEFGLSGSSTVRTFQSLGESVEGEPDLGLGNQTENADGLIGFAEIDLSASGELVLTGRDDGDGSLIPFYNRATIELSNIVFDSGEEITGLLGEVGGLFEAFGESSPFVVKSFSNDSVTLLFDTDKGFINIVDGGVSRFQLVTDVAPVPLPAALPVMMVGIGGLALLRRRKS